MSTILDINNVDQLGNLFDIELTASNIYASGDVLRGGRSSTKYSIPQTTKNRDFFEDWMQLVKINGAEARTKFFLLQDGGFSLRYGRVFLDSAESVKRRGTLYKVIIFYDNEDLFQQIKTLKVSDLDFGTHTNTPTEITTDSPDNFVAGTQDYTYFPCKSRSWLNSGGNYVALDDFWLGIRAVSVIEKALQFSGLKINPTLSSTFLNDTFVKQLIIPVNVHNGYKPEVLTASAGVRANNTSTNTRTTDTTVFGAPPDVAFSVIEADNDSTGGMYDPAGRYTTSTKIYTAEFTATYQVQFKLTFNGTGVTTPPVGQTNLIYVYYKMFDVTAGSYVTVTASNIVNFENYPTTIGWGGGETTFTFNATAGNEYRLDLAYQNAFSGTPSTLISTTLTTSLEEIQIDYFDQFNGQYQTNTNIITRGYIPQSWTVADVWNGLFKMFNLQQWYDPATNVLRIEPADDYVAWSSGAGSIVTGFKNANAMNWDYKRDTTSEEMYLEKGFRALRYKYASSDSDKTLEELNDNYDLKSGSAIFDTNEDGIQDEVFELPFDRVMHIRDHTVSDSDFTPVQVPLFYEENHNDDPTGVTAFSRYDGLTILYMAGRENQDIAGRLRFDNGTTIAFDAYAVAYQCDLSRQTSGATLENVNLLFGDIINGVGEQNIGLAKRFHLARIMSYYKGKKLKTYFKLNPVDILMFNFNARVIIEGTVCDVLQIKMRPGSDAPSETYLLPVHYADSDDVDLLTSSEALPLVVYDP